MKLPRRGLLPALAVLMLGCDSDAETLRRLEAAEATAKLRTLKWEQALDSAAPVGTPQRTAHPFSDSLRIAREQQTLATRELRRFLSSQ